MDQSFMKEQPVFRLVLAMSLPNVLSMLVSSMYNIVDSFFVAQINENAITALSLVFPVQNLINAIGIGFGIGINAMIAIYQGAEKNYNANVSASVGLLFSVVHGAVLTAACIAVMPWFLRLFSSDAEVIAMGLEYSRTAFLFSIVISAEMAWEKIFQAVGRMKTCMFSLCAGCIANIVLDPVLIFGFGPIPAMGIMGAALATGIAQTLILALYILVYVRSTINVKVGKEFLKYERGMLKQLYLIGIPAALNLALPSLLVSALNGILAAYSQVYVVVLGIYYKLQTFVYLTANGIIQGIRPLAGYNYGAGEYERLRRIYRVSLLMCAAIMAVGTAICMFIPEWLFGLFSSNVQTIREGAAALRIISIGFVISAVSISSSGTLEGIGKGMPSLVISMLRYVILMIPAAFGLSRILGPYGVWHGFWITEFLTAGVSYTLYRKETRA